MSEVGSTVDGMSSEKDAESGDDWVWEKKLVGRRVGTEYGRSRDDDGSSSSNLFVPGAKGVKSQARIRDIDEDDHYSEPERIYVPEEVERQPDPLAEFLADVMTRLLDNAIEAAKPHVRRWWNEQVVPAIKSRAESTRAKLAERKAAKTRIEIVEANVHESSTEVESVVIPEQVTLSSEEAQQLLVAALVARAFSDEKIAMLLNARIEDADGPLDWQKTIRQSTPQEVEQQITLMLEANPRLLDDFMRMFWSDHVVDTEREPVRLELPREDG